MKVSKKLVLKYHADACDTFKKRIEKDFPKLFEKKELELNKWYKSTYHEDILIYPTESIRGHLYGYGFYNYDDWVVYRKGNTGCLCNDVSSKYLIPATNKEVETALINEAKKRGFKEGVCIDYIYGTGNWSCFTGFMRLYDGMLIDNVSAVIFKDGEWATIETITKEEAEKQLGKKII